MTDTQAQALLNAFDTGGQVAPLTDVTRLDMTQAYAIAKKIVALRQARGERIVGRKIGFTNRALWPVYGVEAPMWGPMYHTSVAPLPADGVCTLPTPAELRIEPEIAFRTKAPLRAEMTLEEIAAALEWMAHGIEIVTSPFPGWRFTLPDCTAAQALHACFWYGPPRPMPKDIEVLETFSLRMQSPRGTLSGQASDVLDGPLHALRHLVQEIDRHPGAPGIEAGEIITTGTITDAGPVAAGETWQTELSGLDLPGLKVTFA